ncbi:hypothetical protein IRZ81_11010 [Pseudomonas putida]|uniref:hypothetical protein n=1 Tax=Pseudomonas putida TaxID=303 RepID=UPI0018AC88BC|nr:hypothetical protein [Pseudomonas putida]MBF8651331.1 hypothetical protein [Pseudomonas putida]MBF8655027.1 hypothetical protein [Pseudomonas putida]
MNNEISLKYQASVFGDFSKIVPSEETLKRCIESYFSQGWLPSNLQEFVGSKNAIESRLALQSMRTGITINVLSNRIDFIVSPLPGSPAATVTMQSFLTQFSNMYPQLASQFGVAVNRVGFVCDHFLKVQRHEELNIFKSKLLALDLDNFAGDSAMPVEWSVKNTSRIPSATFDGAPINVICNFSKVTAQLADPNGQKEFETPHLSIDVNYPAENTVPSVSPDQVVNFVNEAASIESQVRLRFDELRSA